MKIVGEFDLDDLLTLPSSTFYNFLSSVKKEVFADNERIILYAYSILPDDLISHIKWTLNYLDIPLFFVVLKTNVEQNAKLLDILNVEKLDKTKDILDFGHKPIFNTSNLCAYLNAGLHVWTDGTVSPCCDFSGRLKDNSNQNFNIHTNNLHEIFTSNHMNSLRESLLAGQKPKSCEMCWIRESLGLDSRRTLASYRLKNIYGKINWESTNNIQYIGSHPTNHCNLSCRICSPKFSSVIQSEEIKSGNTVTKFTPAIDSLYKDLENHPDIRVFEILGGEPFLMEKNLRFIEKLIEQKIDKESIFSFTTNGTVFPNFFNNNFNFKRLDITFSIDDIEERFEYQRNRAKWSLLLDNLEKFKQFANQRENVFLGVHTTISILNVLYLPELLDWYNTTGLDYIDFSFVEVPSYLFIGNMTKDAKDQVNLKLNDNFNFVKTIMNNGTFANSDEFIRKISEKDRIRKQNFILNHREIAQAMGFNIQH